MANNVVIDFNVDQQGQIRKVIEDLKELGEKGEQSLKKLNETGNVSAASFDRLVDAGKNLAALAGVGFGLHEIIKFGEESVRQFAAAEKGVQQLLFALNNNVAAHERLITSAERLGKVVGIESSVIVKQQAFLAVQGRTEEQIKKTIAAAVQLSAVTGVDLQSAVQRLSATFEGVIGGGTGGLQKLDSRFKDLTKGELENGAAVDLINEKYKGFAESTLTTTAGKIQQTSVAVVELKERLGKDLSGAFLTAEHAGLSFLEKVVAGFRAIYDPTAFGKERVENFVKQRKEEVQAQAEQLFGAKSILEVETELRRVRDLGFKDNNEKLQKEAQVEALLNILADKRRERDAQMDADLKKQIESLDTLREKLKVLQEEQGAIVDPLGTGAGANAANLSEQKKIQTQIDEITGKAAEERAKNAAKLAEEQQKIREGLIKKSVELEHKIDEDTMKWLQKGADEGKKIEEKGLTDKMDIEAKKREEENKTLQMALDLKERERLEKQEKDRQIWQTATDFARQGTDIIFSNQRDAIQIDADEKIQKLEDQKDKELENKRLTAKQKEEIEKRYQKEESKIKNEAAQKQRTAEIIQAQVNALLAITNIIATAPALAQPFLIASAIATDALAIAAITSKPIPMYRYGKEKVEGAGTRTSDSILARISLGERIVDADTNEKYFPILSAIHNKKISARLANSLIDTPSFSQSDLTNILMLTGGLIDYDKLGASVARHALLMADQLKFKNRNDSHQTIINIQAAEDNIRRR